MSEEYRSNCPIASTLDLVGDRWTLLILRDMLFGARRFLDFVGKPEGITRNILTDRLRRMEAAGLIRREIYQTKPERFRYLPTEKGADLLPAIQALAAWGGKHLGHVYQPPETLLALRPGDVMAAAGARTDQTEPI